MWTGNNQSVFLLPVWVDFRLWSELAGLPSPEGKSDTGLLRNPVHHRNLPSRCTSGLRLGLALLISPCSACKASLSLKHLSILSLSPLFHFWFLDNSWFCFIFCLFLYLFCFVLVVPFSLKDGMVCLYFKKFKIFFKQGKTTNIHQ